MLKPPEPRHFIIVKSERVAAEDFLSILLILGTNKGESVIDFTSLSYGADKDSFPIERR